MKKIIFSAIAAVCAITAQAQDKKFEFGVKAGANLSTLSGDFEDAEARIGFHAGALVNYHFNENFSVQPELLFSMQGADSSYEEDVFGTLYKNQSIELTYLNLPVLAKYHFSGVKGLSVGLGPQVGVLLSAKQKFDVVTEGVSTSQDEDIKDELKTVDFGAVADVEYKLPVGVFFSARANVGFANINDGDDKVHNTVFQLSAGYRF